MKINQVFLDLDGVLVDFIGGVIEHHKLNCTPEDCTEWGTILDIYKTQYPGASNRTFWGSLDRDFWLGLKLYPWASDVIKYLTLFKPIILTAPTLTNAGWKQEFIRNNFPDFFNDKRYIITPSHTKYVLAKPNALLIDDRQSNVDDFRKAGGVAFVWPQPWSLPQYRDAYSHPLAFFKSRIDAISTTRGFETKVQ